jgi:predicted RNA methylase
MSRISRAVQKRHEKVLKLLESKELFTHNETLQVFQDYHEGATNLNGLAGAFFTPYGLARDFALEVTGNSVIDLCAGIGSLSYACSNANTQDRLVCIELNPEYAAIGKKLVPWANWYCRDVTELNELAPEDKFDMAISNPPFGNISGHSMFDLEVVLIASKLARRAVFILPQQSTPYRYSGCQGFSSEVTDKLERWMDKHDQINFEFNCGIDCDLYIQDWKGVKPVVEIVLFEFGDN